MKSIVILICAFLLFSGCKSTKELVVEEESFDQFYDLFHSDEAFQYSRIVFPLEGGSAQVDATIPWTKENWITMKVKIYDIDKNQFKTDFEKTENTFVQTFEQEGTGFGAEYRFKKVSGKWFLVYALDSNL